MPKDQLAATWQSDGEDRPRSRWLADRCVVRATRHALDPGDQQRLELQIAPPASGANGCLISIEAFIHAKVPLTEASPPPALLVLKFPGTAGRGERSAPLPDELLPGSSSEVWTWNPPGYGRSPGRPSLRTMAAAAPSYFDAVLQRRGGPDTKVWLMGNSLGCTTALWVAAQRNVDALVLRNPPPLGPTIRHVATRGRRGPAKWIGDRLGSWISRGVPDAMNALKTAPRCTMPAVFAQSAADQLVPPALQQQVRDAYGGPIRLVSWHGLAHDGIPEPEQLADFIAALRWLVGLPGGGNASST